MSKNLTSTKEWATSNLNIATGCSNNCRYCYARHNAVNRFKTVTVEDWPKMVVSRAKIDKQYRKRDGVIMFPSSHDIVPEILDDYCTVLLKLLKAGNRVLIVSKPRMECIKVICRVCKKHKRQVEFRFTIGSSDSDTVRFWEPGASSKNERIYCLEHVCEEGFALSVSCEPYLDTQVFFLYRLCEPYITGDFWVGKLNGFNQRVNLDGVTEEQMKLYIEPLKEIITDDAVMELYREMNGLPSVKWKDSFREVVERNKNGK